MKGEIKKVSTNTKCCNNCEHCEVRHAGQNIVFYQCNNDDCTVEPDDFACEDFVLRADRKENNNK